MEDEDESVRMGAAGLSVTESGMSDPQGLECQGVLTSRSVFTLDDPVFGALIYDPDAETFDGEVTLDGDPVAVSINMVDAGSLVVPSLAYDGFRGIREKMKRAEALIREWFTESDNEWALDEDEQPLDSGYLDGHLTLCDLSFEGDGDLVLWYAMLGEFDCLWGHSLLVTVERDGAFVFEGLVG